MSCDVAKPGASAQDEGEGLLSEDELAALRPGLIDNSSTSVLGPRGWGLCEKSACFREETERRSLSPERKKELISIALNAAELTEDPDPVVSKFPLDMSVSFGAAWLAYLFMVRMECCAC